jgi:serine/threonine protein kinase
VKQLLEITPPSVARFRFECFLMKNLRHPHIVRLIGVCWDDMLLACVLEYADCGTLEDHLRKDWSAGQGEKMTWRKILLRYARHAASGISYLHNSRYFDEEDSAWKECIIHRDLKPDIMLVDSSSKLMLSDFGEAQAEETDGRNLTVVGTPIYMAPEVLSGDFYTSEADSYSFGIVLVAMLRCDSNILQFFVDSLRRSMGKNDNRGLGVNILNHRMTNQGWRPLLPVDVYPSLLALIDDCWSGDQSKRPTFDVIEERLNGNVAIEVEQLNEPDIFQFVSQNLKDDADRQLVRSRRPKKGPVESTTNEGTMRLPIASAVETSSVVALD